MLCMRELERQKGLIAEFLGGSALVAQVLRRSEGLDNNTELAEISALSRADRHTWHAFPGSATLAELSLY
jgi:hypothetical protein